MPDRDDLGGAWRVSPSRYLAGRPAEFTVGDHFAQAPHGRPPLLVIFSGSEHASLLELPTAQA